MAVPMHATKLYDPAERIKNVPFSPVRKVMERAVELEKQGNRMVYFQIGEPDFNTPKPVVDATIEALQQNRSGFFTRRTPSRRDTGKLEAAFFTTMPLPSEVKTFFDDVG
jgi:aspartate/methionine/tyrosine aminotransferase